jgi:hypothetical protein
MTSAFPFLSKLRARYPPSGVRFADDLDRVNRLLADLHVDVVDEEIAARQHLVGVGSDDGNAWITKHAAGRVPDAGDRLEASVRGCRGTGH